MNFNILKKMWQRFILRIARLFLNGNVQRLENTLAEVRRLKRSLEEFERARKDRIESVKAIDEFYSEWLQSAEKVEDELGNLLTIVLGFSRLHAQIEEVKAWYADEKNIKWLKETNDQT